MKGLMFWLPVPFRDHLTQEAAHLQCLREMGLERPSQFCIQDTSNGPCELPGWAEVVW